MIRVIGIGSPFGDDSAAWTVIERLAAKAPEGVDLVALNQPGAGLLNWFDGVEHLVLIDVLASDTAAAPFIRITADGIGALATTLSSHGQQLGTTLALAAELGCLPTCVEIFAIPVASPNGEQLQAATRTAAAALATHLLVHLDEFATSAGHPGPGACRTGA